MNKLFNQLGKQLNVPLSSLSASSGGDAMNPMEMAAAAATTAQSPMEALQMKANESVENADAPNETILQLVAQIPNHPLQKIAQRLITDQPKAGAEALDKTAGFATSSTSTNNLKTANSKCLLNDVWCFRYFNVVFASFSQVPISPTSLAYSAR